MENQDYDAGNTSMSELRRRYPKNMEGAKDEWQALIKHQHEVNELLNHAERIEKKNKQIDLGSHYEQKRVEQRMMAEEQLRRKQEEAYNVQLKQQAYKADLARQKEEQNVLKNHLADHYTGHIDNKHQTEQYKKALTLAEEKQMVENAKRRAEEAQRRELAKQQEYNQIFNEEIRRAEEKNQKLLEGKIQEKLEYRDNIRDNERRQILKEENYRNFFKLSVENQKKLMDLHAQNVLSPQLQKEAHKEAVIEHRVNEERERKQQEEMARQQWRNNATHNVGSHNKETMGHHEYMKSLERQGKQIQVQESLKQSMEYHDFLNSQKNVKKETQKNYKEFLDRQAIEQQERDRMNKMTKHEKKINAGDLQAYKNIEAKMYGLLPGFIHSKYEHPLGGHEIEVSPGRRTKNNIYAEKLNTLQNGTQSVTNLGASLASPKYSSYPAAQQSPGNSQQASPVKARQIETNTYQQIDNSQSQQSPNNFQTKTFTKLDNTFSARDLSPNYRSMTQMNNNSPVRGGHNPITNPLPNNNQNPYIAREINMAATKRPYFANMASNNLIG